jgi:hypothetical protein
MLSLKLLLTQHCSTYGVRSYCFTYKLIDETICLSPVDAKLSCTVWFGKEVSNALSNLSALQACHPKWPQTQAQALRMSFKQGHKHKHKQGNYWHASHLIAGTFISLAEGRKNVQTSGAVMNTQVSTNHRRAYERPEQSGRNISGICLLVECDYILLFHTIGWTSLFQILVCLTCAIRKSGPHVMLFVPDKTFLTSS